MRSAFEQSRASVVSLTASFGKRLGIILIILLLPCFCFAQPDSTNAQTLSKKQKTNRQIFIGAVNVVGYGASLIILSNTWYRNYPRTSFHTFNDVDSSNKRSEEHTSELQSRRDLV